MIPKMPAPHFFWLPALALLTAPAAVAAEASSPAVVLDLGQARWFMGGIGLWLVAVWAFALCADKRIRPMSHLARYLERRAGERADAALRALAQDDPRILADLIAATDHARADVPWEFALQTPPDAASVANPPSRHLAARGFRTAPLPGLPRHLQYLPA